MNVLFTKVALLLGAPLLAVVTALSAVASGASSPHSPSGRAPGGSIVINWAGQGRLETPKPTLATTRYEGRFVIFGLGGADHSILPPDASLFDPACVSKFGVGVQCAYLVAVRDGAVEGGFMTGDSASKYTGQEVGWSVPGTETNIYFDPHPDGSRSFADRVSFTDGRLVATYSSTESLEIDPDAGTFYTRVSYQARRAATFVLDGTQLNFAQFAPRMTESAVGHNPAPLASPEQIPANVPVFNSKGPGSFSLLFAVSGSVMAAG